jgi:hypothetical protein
MEGINSFEKGLHRSNSPVEQPEGSYADAYNWIRNDSGRLTNEEQEEIIQSLTDAYSYEFLGACPIKDSFICFLKQTGNNGNLYSEIGVFDNKTKTYRRVFNDFFANGYTLNFVGPIDSVARINSLNQIVVYFVEKSNVPRRFNITAFEDLLNINPSPQTAYTAGLYDSELDWNLQLNFKMPYATYNVLKGGSLPSGIYSFAFRYVTDDNNKTTFNIPSRFINIPVYSDSSGVTPIYNDATVGGAPQTPSDFSIEMSLKNLDTNYRYIEPVVITYVGITNALSIKSLGLFEISTTSTISFNSTTQYLNDISESAITELPVKISSAECIEQKDNVLVLSNITSRKFDTGFQAVANAIELEWYIESKPVNNYRDFDAVTAFNATSGTDVLYNSKMNFAWYSPNWNISLSSQSQINASQAQKFHYLPDPDGTNYRRFAFITPGTQITSDYGNSWSGAVEWYDSNSVRFLFRNSTFTQPTISKDNASSNSNVYQDPLLLKGFTRGEVYSFAITPIYKDGSMGFAYHIPGQPYNSNKPRRLIEWLSSNNYTSVYNNNGLSGKIRHHRMPDHDEIAQQYPAVKYLGDLDDIHILRVRAANINFTQDQLNNIQGYIISYQPRNTELNTRVVDTGFVRPYIQNQQSRFQASQHVNSPLYIAAPWTGNVGVFDEGPTGKYSFYGPNWFFNTKYARYHSPDDEVYQNKIKASYKIQRIGFGLNEISHRNDLGDLLYYFEPHAKMLQRFSRLASINTLPICASVSNAIQDSLDLKLIYEFNGFYFDRQNPSIINSTEFIPDIGNNNNATLENGEISLKTNSRYRHLNVSSSLFFITDNYEERKFITKGHFVISQGGPRRGFQMFGPHLNRAIPILVSANSTATTPPTLPPNTNLSDTYQRFGIVFCRVINELFAQYGTLENAEYTPSVVEMDDNGLSSTVELEGDTYISKYFHHLYDTAYGHTGSDTTNFTGTVTMGIYAESKTNYSLRHYDSGTVPFYPKYKNFINSNQTDFGLYNHNWWMHYIGINKQYAAVPNLRKSFSKPLFFNEIVSYTNRSVYSNKVSESEISDSYRYFPSLQFHDIPKDRGEIKDTFVFNNTFYHHTEYALWQSFFNPNTTQTTSTGQVILGNPGIFTLPSRIVLDIKGGYMGTMDKSGTNTPFGRVFLDHKQGKIFLLTGESPVEISDLGLFSYFRDFINENDKYCMGYDWANKRLLINNITRERAISFYPKTQTWTSFHSFSPTAYFTTNGSSFAFKESQVFKGSGGYAYFYNMNNSKDIRKSSYITFVTNTSPDAFKRFDRIEMNTMSGGLTGISSPGSIPEPQAYSFDDQSFTHIHAWTDRQNTTNLPLFYPPSHDFNTTFLANYDSSKVPVNYYRSSFHAELPLDAVIDPYKNIFDPNNVDINADFKSHLKGKFLYTKLAYNKDTPLVVNYVKTLFKPTVA